MGFTTLTAAGLAATAAQTALSYQSNRAQSKSLKALAQEELENGKEHADALTNTALSNSSRAKRNMENQVGKARLDAAASGLTPSGSAYRREVDLTTRLQDEITQNTQSALDQANLAYNSSLNNANSLNMSAQAAKTKSLASIISGTGSMLNQIGNYTLANSQEQAKQQNNANSLWSL